MGLVPFLAAITARVWTDSPLKGELSSRAAVISEVLRCPAVLVPTSTHGVCLGPLASSCDAVSKPSDFHTGVLLRGWLRWARLLAEVEPRRRVQETGTESWHLLSWQARGAWTTTICCT